MTNIRLYSASTVTDPTNYYFMLTGASDDKKILNTAMLTWLFSGLGGTSSVVTLTGIQTLINKTLTSPTINTPTIATPTVTNGSYTSGSFATPTITTPVLNGSSCTSSGANIDTASAIVVGSGVTQAELAYLDGLTGNVQTQIGTKLTETSVCNYSMQYTTTFLATTNNYDISASTILAGLNTPLSTVSYCINAKSVDVRTWLYNTGNRYRTSVSDTYKLTATLNGSGLKLVNLNVAGITSGSYYTTVVTFRIATVVSGA